MESVKKKTMKIIDSMFELLGDSEEQTIDEVREELTSDGIDIDATLARIKKKNEEYLMAAKRTILEDAGRKRLEMERTNSQNGNYRDWSIDKIKERIKGLITGCDLEIGFAHRELDSMGKEELESALEDLELTLRRQELEEKND